MKPIAKMSIGELAAYISSHLRQLGIDTVLSGGSCVAIYSAGMYVSKDLDFIKMGSVTARKVRDAMLAIGFVYEHGVFKHPHTELLADFPAGPLSVGEEPVGAIAEIQFSTGLLRILSPIDCVKDRLAGYYHWEDLQCLEQAVLVARSNPVDLNEVRRWSDREGMSDAFKRIVDRFER